MINNEYRLADIRMESIIVGNGFLDLESMMCYGDFLYQMGLVDNKHKAKSQ